MSRGSGQVSRRSRKTGHLALTTEFGYDAAGRRTTIKNPRGHTTSYTFDFANRLTAMTDPLQGLVDIDLDAAGRTVAVTNARGKTTTYSYNSLGQVLTETNPLGRTWTNAYDLAGRRTSQTDPRGVTVGYVYDNADRLTTINYPAVGGQPAGSMTYGWDAANRQTGMVDPTGGTGWTYDGAGRVTQVSSPQGTIGYSYDSAGRRATVTLPGNRTTTYAYDNAGQLTTVTDWQNRATTFTHDLDGRRASTVRPNGVGTVYSYDLAGRLSMAEHAAGGNMMARYVYALDPNGNRTSVTISGSAVAAGTETYQYDQLDRLTQATYPGNLVVSYQHDANGNVTQKTDNGVVIPHTYNDADELTQAGPLAYGHDNAGNMVSAGADSFAWDWAGRMRSATAGGATTTYAYAGDDVRASRTTGGGTTSFLWDREAGLPELVDDGTQAYLHEGDVLAGIDASGAAAYPLADGLGSVRVRTDGAGAAVGTADYDAYGATRASTGAGGTFGFAGEQREPETGQYHLRARQYAPGLGRFTSRDSVSPNASGTQGYNGYAYANNNPATLTDPSGHAAVGAVTAMLEPALALAIYVKNLRDVSRLMPSLSPAARGLVQALMGLAVFALKIMVLMVAVYALTDFLMRHGKTMLGLAIGFLGWVKGFGKGLFQVAKQCAKNWRDCLRLPQWLPRIPKSCVIGAVEELAVLGITVTVSLAARLVGEEEGGQGFGLGKGDLLGFMAGTAAGCLNLDEIVGHIKRRTAELTTQLGRSAGFGTTMAVGVVRDRDGTLIALVATNETSLRRGVTIGPEEVLITSTPSQVQNRVHAEILLLDYAASMGYEVISVGATTGICEPCEAAIRAAGGVPATRTRSGT